MYLFYILILLLIGFPGRLDVCHYKLDLVLWGDDDSFALSHLKDIYSTCFVNNALKFDLAGISVDFNRAQVSFNQSFGVHDIVVKTATAFAVATLLVIRMKTRREKSSFEAALTELQIRPILTKWRKIG